MTEKKLSGKIKDAASKALENELNELIEGSKADVRAFAAEMANDALEAGLTLPADRRVAVLGQMKDDLKVLAEKHRLRAVNGAWDVVEQVAMASLKTAVTVAVAAV